MLRCLVLLSVFYYACYAAVYIRDGEDTDGFQATLLNEQLEQIEYLNAENDYSPQLQKRNTMPNEDTAAVLQENDTDKFNTDLVSPTKVSAGKQSAPSSSVKRTDLENPSESMESNDNEDDYTGETENKEDAAETDNSESGSGETDDEPISVTQDNEISPEMEATTESSGSESGDHEDVMISQITPEEDEESNIESGSGTSVENESENAHFQEVDTNKPQTQYESSVRRRDQIPVPSTDKKSAGNKRQYIARPRFVIRDGYVYMKAPPMTQKTIVTTHIPRPPMVMPYNTFLHRYRNDYGRLGGAGFGMGMGGHHGHGRLMYPSQQFSDDGYDTTDDHAEECEHLVFVEIRMYLHFIYVKILFKNMFSQY